MKNWPHGVTGTRNEHLLQALDLVLRERQVHDDERHAFRAGFIEGWQAHAVAEPGKVTVTREHLADLERAAEHAPDNTCTCPCRGECTT